MADPAAFLPTQSACTCFRMRRATRRMTQLYDAHLAPAGLTLPQYSLLANLERRQRPSMHELAEVMGMDRTTLSRNLQPLRARSLVEAVAGADRRSKSLALTAAGRALWAEARPLWLAAQAEITARLGAPMVAELHQLLDASFDKLAN